MTIKTAKADQRDVIIANVMKATGLSKEQANRILLMDDGSLDGLCYAALSYVSELYKKVGPSEP